MIKYILSFLTFLPLFLNAQSLYQNPILDYLGSSIDEAGLTNGSVGIYNGLGKEIFIKNYPTAWGNGITAGFSPKGNVPYLFGGLTLHSASTWRPVVGVSGSHLGEIDLTAKGDYRVKRLRNNFQINGHFFNHRKDENDDGFLDLPLKKRLSVRHVSKLIKENYRGSLELFYLKIAEQGGDINFDKTVDYLNDSVYGFGSDVNHVGFKFSNSFQLKEYPKPQFIRVDFAGRLHRQDSYFGLREYVGDEDLLEGMIGYQRNMLLSDLELGVRYKYQNTEEKLIKQSFNRQESVVGWYGKHRWVFSEKWELNTFVNWDYHNILKWEFQPAFKLNYQPDDDVKLGVFAGSGYQFANVLAENQELLISSRNIFLENLSATKAAYLGGAMQSNISGLFDFYVPVLLKSQYFFRRYNNQAVVDLDQSADELHFYDLKGDARRHVFENMMTINRSGQWNLMAIYRLDIAKTTIDNQLRTLPFHSLHNFFLVGDFWLDNKVKWQMNYIFGSPQRIPNQTEKSPAIHRLDTRIDVLFNGFLIDKKWQPLTVFVDVENILNQRQTDIYRETDAPFERGFDGGLRWGREVGIRVFGGVKYQFR